MSTLLPLPNTNVPVAKHTSFEISPSGSMTFTSTMGKDEKPFIHISASSHSLKIDVSEKHGKILGDSWFGGVTFSHDERFIAYVALPKSAKVTTSFDAEKNKFPNKFEYKEDWGEKFTGVVSTVICIVDTVTGNVRVLSGTDNETIGAPVFSIITGTGTQTNSANNYTLVYTSWEHNPRKLGMIYCYQRPCALYSVTLDWILANQEQETAEVDITESKDIVNYGLEGHALCLTASLAQARSARFSPDGKYMIYIGRRDSLGSHK